MIVIAPVSSQSGTQLRRTFDPTGNNRAFEIGGVFVEFVDDAIGNPMFQLVRPPRPVQSGSLSSGNLIGSEKLDPQGMLAFGCHRRIQDGGNDGVHGRVAVGNFASQG